MLYTAVKLNDCSKTVNFASYDWTDTSSNIHSHLMGKLMANHHGNPEFIRNRGGEGVKEKAGLSVGGQAPVLHRTGLEVWDRNQIWAWTLKIICGLIPNNK